MLTPAYLSIHNVGLIYQFTGDESHPSTTFSSDVLGSYEILTLGTWVRVEASSKDYIFSFGDSTSPARSSAHCFWNISSSSASYLCCSMISSTESDHMCSASSFNANSWIHAIVIFNPVDAEMKLFINGDLSSTFSKIRNFKSRFIGFFDLLFISEKVFCLGWCAERR